jgi:hypothetical protein
MDCWKALHNAKTLFWIDLSNDFDFQKNDSSDRKRLDIDECVHYADPANANLHILLPGKLLSISCPADLPDGRQWMDDGARRHFSPAFYADLLGEFDVVLVLCLENCGYDCGPFTKRGIGVEELHLRNDSPDLLRAADRFLSLLRAAPGAVALHGSADALRLAGALVSAHMMSRLGFGAADAAAWLRMVRPALLMPPEHLDLAALSDGADLLLAGEPAAAAAFLRCLSAPPPPAAALPGGADAGPTRGAAAGPGLRHVNATLERPSSLPDVIL